MYSTGQVFKDSLVGVFQGIAIAISGAAVVYILDV